VRLVLYDKGTEEQDGGVQLTHFAIMLDALGAALLCMLHLHNPNYLYTFTTPPFVYLQQPPTDRRGVNKIPGTTNSTHGQITISIFRSLAGGEPFYLNKHNTCFLHSNGGRYVIRNYSALFKDDFRFLRGCPSDEPFSCMVTLPSWLRNMHFRGG
jgi:hypothetical protein